MNIDLEDFKTGWFGITVGIKTSEIDILIEGLTKLKGNEGQHFHARSDCSGNGGVADIEFYLEAEDTKDNATLDLSPAINPNR